MARTAALLAAVLLLAGASAEPQLRPRRALLRTELQAADYYAATAAEHALGLRLLVKFSDGLAIRGGSGGVRSELEHSRGHVAAINRTIAQLGAVAVEPLLS